MPSKNIEIIATLEKKPEQGIRALVDTVYLYNPDAINELIVQLNEVLKKVDVGNYNSLEDKPVLSTYDSDSLAPDSGEVIQGVVKLHKISKTGSYTDLNDKPALGALAYKDTITDADVADDAGIEKSKLSVGVQESLDKADKSVGDIAAEAQTRENEDIRLKSQIDSNADAIQKTREDYASADAELLSKIEDNTSEISTLKTDLDDLGDQVSTIEEKIPEQASSSNQLVTNTQLSSGLDTKADKSNTYTKQEVDEKVSSVYRFKGSVNTYNDLPSSAVVGDVYNVLDTGSNYAWDGTRWDKLSETVDLTPYLTKEEAAETYDTITSVNNKLLTKQDTLVAGNNISIINNTISVTDFESLLPDQEGHEDEVLSTDGSNAEWTGMPGLIIRRL